MSSWRVWAVNDPNELTYRLRRYINQRFVYLVVLTGAGVIAESLTQPWSVVLTDLLAGLLGLALNGLFFVLARSKTLRAGMAVFIGVAIITIDICLISYVTYTHGGIESLTVALYVVPLLAAGIIFGGRAMYWAAGLIAVVYDSLLVAQWAEIIGRPGARVLLLHLDTRYLIEILIFYTAVFFITAVVAHLANVLLEESESRVQDKSLALSQALHIAHLGSWEWDAVSNRVTMSDEMCAILGVKPDKAPGDYDAVMAFFIPADRKRLDEAVRNALQYQEPYKISIQFMRTDGILRTMLAEGRAITGQDGRVIKLVGTAQDVTEQQTVQSQLIARSRELEQTREAILNVLQDLEKEKKTIEQERVKDAALLTSLGEGLVVIDAEGKITKVNPTGLALLGYGEKDLVGQWFPKALPTYDDKGNEVPPLDRPVIQALSSGEAVSRAVVHKKKDGTPFPAQVTVSPFVIEGKPAGAIVVFRDITREKQLEKAKDEFLSIASHELRTPMGAIRAMVTMILGGDYGQVGDNLKEPLTDIRSSTLRLVSLVNDLLNVARIEAGRLKFTLTDFDIGETVREVTATLMPLGKEKGVVVAVEKSETVSTQGDIDKVKEVLTNLMGNSLKFTDKGSIKASITKLADRVEVDVTDTGMGISREDQAKLFGKFQQISSAQTGKPQGTGLGLYISRELIRKMGGDLWIKSSETGKGSTFAFTLPLTGSTIAKQAQAAIAKEAKEHTDQK